MATPPVHTPAMGKAAALLIASQEVLRGFLEYAETYPSKYQLRLGEQQLITDFLLYPHGQSFTPEKSHV
jgi:hypothetical protein